MNAYENLKNFIQIDLKCKQLFFNALIFQRVYLKIIFGFLISKSLIIKNFNFKYDPLKKQNIKQNIFLNFSFKY
jgi:hypothetical protein